MEVGLGVIANRAIPRGTIVWAQDRFDRVIPRLEALALDAHHRAIVDRYAHLDGDGNRILCWDAGRLVDHACDPSIRGIGPSIMVARRDLRAGDEITCDYAECNLEEPLDCDCQSAGCRTRIHGLDLLRLGPAWDDEARALLTSARGVPQPVLPFAIDRGHFDSMARGDAPIPSFVSQSHLRQSSADA